MALLFLWAQFTIYPLELVRTRLAVCPMGTYRGMSDCFRQIVRLEGYRAFYRGLSPSLVRAPTPHPASCLACMGHLLEQNKNVVVIGRESRVAA